MTMYCIILYMYVYIRIVIIKVHVLLVHYREVSYISSGDFNSFEVFSVFLRVYCRFQ